MKTAERRMFAKTIVTSDAFLEMPASARCLYFLLGMQADDDGFVNRPKAIMRESGSSDDDMRILISKSFLIPFKSGVVVIKHWKIHNLIKNDRYKETKYLEEKSTLTLDSNNAYTQKAESLDPKWDTSGSHLEPQDRLGKDSIGKYIEGESFSDDSHTPQRNEYEEIRLLYNSICTKLPKCTKLSENRRKALRARIASGYSIDDFHKLFSLAEASDFLTGSNSRNWIASFDWLIKDANAVKVLDGNYENRKQKQQTNTWGCGELGEAEREAIRQLMEE